MMKIMKGRLSNLPQYRGGNMADTTRSEQNQPKQPPVGSSQATEQTASSARQARGYMSDMDRQMGQMGQSAQRAKERVSDVADQARETINQAYTRASRGMNETWDQAMDYSKDHPATATLIAFGAGVGVGLFLAGSLGGFQSRSRTRRIVPPVMNAISEIAREFFR
jgi:ElaB/YqjD/DUF883 family membrane-anchored ribosome-binding protein